MSFKITIEAFGNEMTLDHSADHLQQAIQSYLNKRTLEDDVYLELNGLIEIIEEGKRNYFDEINS
jgi:hypothetical protein